MNFQSVTKEIANNGVKIDQSAYNKMLEFYKNKELDSLCKLRDMGYISSIQDFSLREFLKCVREEFGDKINVLYSALDGTLSVTTESLALAMSREQDMEFKELLSVLYDYINSEDIKDELKSMKLDGNMFKPRVVEYSSYISVNSSNIVNRKELLYIMEANPKYRIVYLKGLLYCTFLKSMGITEEQIERFKRVENRGVILRGVSFQEEVDNCRHIMEFHAQCDTEFKRLYDIARIKYYTSNQNKIAKRNPEPYKDEFVECVNLILDCIQDNEIKPIILTPHIMIVKQNVTRLSEKLNGVIGRTIEVKMPRRRIWENSGFYTLDWYNISEFSKANSLRGLTGEFVLMKDIENDNIFKDKLSLRRFLKENTPIDIVTVDKNGIKTEKAFRAEDLGLKFRVGDETSGLNLEFVYGDINKVYRKLGITKEEAKETGIIQRKVLMQIKNMPKTFKVPNELVDYYNLVIADLVCALICKDCGTTFTSIVPLNEKIDALYENDNELFYKASFEAQEYINKNRIIETHIQQ